MSLFEDNSLVKLVAAVVGAVTTSVLSFRWLFIQWAKQREENEGALGRKLEENEKLFLSKIELVFANAAAEREARRAELEVVERTIQAEIDRLRDTMGKEILVLRERSHELANNIGATTTAVKNVADLMGKLEGYMRAYADATSGHVTDIKVALGRLEERIERMSK